MVFPDNTPAERIFNSTVRALRLAKDRRITLEVDERLFEKLEKWAEENEISIKEAAEGWLDSHSRHFPIQVGEETLRMLYSLALQMGRDPFELADELFENSVGDKFSTEDQNVQQWRTLSERQREVAAGICKGLTNGEIAAEYNISVSTVKKHVQEVLRKFEVKGRRILQWTLKDWKFDDLNKPWPQ